MAETKKFPNFGMVLVMHVTQKRKITVENLTGLLTLAFKIDILHNKAS